MSEKSTLYEETVKHKGYFTFSELYNFCYQWLKEEGYLITEKKYEEKFSGDAKEIKLKWEAFKKVSDYFKNTIEISWHIIGMKDAQIERDGKKEDTNKGEIKIKFVAVLERDYEAKWEDKPFWKFLRGIYDRYIIKTNMEQYEKQLIEKNLDMIEQVKAFLQLEGKR